MVIVAELAGLILLAGAVVLLALAWPKGGTKRAFLHSYTVEVSYTLAVMLLLTGGTAAVLYGILA